MELWEKDFLNKSKNITQTIKCLDSYSSYQDFAENYKTYDITFIRIAKAITEGKDWYTASGEEMDILKKDIGMLAINYLYDNI